jgi:hypothetical protein
MDAEEKRILESIANSLDAIATILAELTSYDSDSRRTLRVRKEDML